jgi:hypothetical protein
MRRPLPAGTLAMLAPWPAAGPTLAFLQLLLGPANAAFSGHMLLGIPDPTDELVTGQGRDVFPGTECRRVGEQRVTHVCRQRVYDPTGHLLAAHGAMVEGDPVFLVGAGRGIELS